MTIDQSTGYRRTAATARSILSCPAEVQLVVDGLTDLTGGIEPEQPGGVPVLRMHELDGRPTFSCPATANLALAAAEGRRALLTATSALGSSGAWERGDTVTVAGSLRATLEECTCCSQLRSVVTIEPDLVALGRVSASDEPLHVPLSDFASADLRLNRGVLQRTMDHANTAHQTELRHAVATTSGTAVHRIAAVALGGLTPDRVEVHWVDPTGAHVRVIEFARTAASSDELGELLREELHTGIC